MDEREITHYFIVTNQLHRRMVESNLEGMRIHRAQHRLLMTLSCKRSYSQVEIAKELEVSPATIAVALKNLEKEQYIVRTSKEGDNRVKDVLLTEKGQKLVEDSREYFNLVDSEMYQGFSEQEKKQFVDFLKRIYHNMERLSNKQAERKKRKER